ncbi:hypothetical protein [Merismopedia glauca]|uniref:Uncharacterized protein n=1 Tax=Merismopedia glauca CCAP 1448/3 TaxID=1296344 RepID=A0A2T1C990_9CYAN|nr:hypothetical protein [Merismopedia glauca]PSB04804.1 hypothetical protein C7B64_02270 [Merismopedia glauca CCAP 1448/3]
MKRKPNFSLTPTTVVTAIYLVSQVMLGLVGSQPLKAQSANEVANPGTINCLKIAGNTPVVEPRNISVGKKLENSIWSLKAYPNFFHLFSCGLPQEANLSKLEGSFAIPDDSTLLQAQILFYTEGNLTRTLKVDRDEVKQFDIPLNNVRDLAIEYRFIGGGSYDYLHALNWQYK